MHWKNWFQCLLKTGEKYTFSVFMGMVVKSKKWFVDNIQKLSWLDEYQARKSVATSKIIFCEKGLKHLHLKQNVRNF